jgi:hypothetical protein
MAFDNPLVFAPCVVAACLVHLGQLDLARAEVARIEVAWPGLTIAGLFGTVGPQASDGLLVEGLLRAGLSA